MQKIAVCGDSYMTPVVNPAGSHFAERLSKTFNSELYYYSRGGMSNAGIGIQVEDAIQLQPDLILLDTTFVDRVEFNIADKQGHDFHTTDIVYAHTEAVASQHPWFNKNSTMIVDNLNSLLALPGSPERWNNLYKDIPNINEKITALKQYVTYLYDPKWKRQLDLWCMYAVLHKLERSGIPYLIVLDALGVRNFEWITERTYIAPKISQYYTDPNFWKTDKDPGYHTPPEVQENICQEILKHLREWKFINE